MQGTLSVLFGCHSPIHSLLVLLAWRKLYGVWPEWWQVSCIFLHDIGHWGKQYLDDYEAKKRHWQAGARIARYLFGEAGFELIAGHNVYGGYAESLLYRPDKASWALAPYWWLWSNTIVEPKLRMGYSRREAVERFRAQVATSLFSGEFRNTHEFFLERCKGGHS